MKMQAPAKASERKMGHNTDLMLGMLESPDSWWVREAGSLEAVLEKSLRECVEWLTDKLGPDERSWQWGRLHYITFGHAMGAKKPLDTVFNLGPLPVGGDTDTPFQTGIVPSKGFDGINCAPSHRQIIDLSDFSNSLMIHPPGQSGQLGSPHYDDLLELWAAGRYHPMLWKRAEIEQSARGTLRLSCLPS